MNIRKSCVKKDPTVISADIGLLSPSGSIFISLFFFFLDFIYLLMRDRHREAETETETEGEAGSLWGA